MIVLYPCYSFETLASDRTETEAKELLAAWLAAFHPALIETFDAIPRWESASSPPYDVDDEPIVIPPCCESFLSEDWLQRQEEGGRPLFRTLSRQSEEDKREVQAKLLEMATERNHGFDADFIADFRALALACFLVEILVRKLQYTSMMDDARFATHLLEAIRAYRRDERDVSTDHLKRAFETICQSKEYFYSVHTYFLDLTLITETTAGEPLRRLLETRRRDKHFLNLFLPSRLLDRLPDLAPDTFASLKRACESGNVRCIVDDTEKTSLLLLPLLDMADRMLDGVSIFHEKLNVSPTVYGRLSGSLNPLLPQILKLAGMQGVLLFAPLDGKHFEDETQSKAIWQGRDGTKLDALIRYPLNAAKEIGFFELATQLAETINSDHAPTAVFASFPSATPTVLPGLLRDSGSEPAAETWLDDLHRLERFESASRLGTFMPVDQYFEETAQCGGVKNWNFNDFAHGILKKSVAAGEVDPISSWNRLQRESAERNATSASETCLSLLKQPTAQQTAVDLPAARRFAMAVAGIADRAEAQGILVTNPWSFPRRVFLDISDWPALPEESEIVVLARQTGEKRPEKKEIVVDVPPMGYAFVSCPNPREPERIEARQATPEAGLLRRVGRLFQTHTTAKVDPPLIREAEEEQDKGPQRRVFILQNEIFEAKIDAETGMLRSIFTDNYRYNRLSRQLAFRMPDESRPTEGRDENGPNRGYASMQADKIEIEQAGPITGKLKIAGRLVDLQGLRIARFEETVTVKRKSRLLEFDLKLEPDVEWERGKNPWDTYFCIRYAWHDDTMSLRGCLGDGVFPLSGVFLQSPRFVDLRGDNRALTFFSEGLPFHRRRGDCRLDTILVAGNETARHFRSGIGIDFRYPVAASLEFLARKDDLVHLAARCPHTPSAWLFQIEAKNVLALHWEPLTNEEGVAVGFRVFLLETEGRPAHFALRSFLSPKQAAATNLQGETIKNFRTEHDKVLIDMRAHELLPLNVLFEHETHSP